MSIIGTRPPLLSETSLYELHHRARLAIKPGITGMWQVSGRSDITDFEEVVRLDKEYIENWNIGLDINAFIVRLPSVYGPTMQKSDSKAHAQFIRNALNGENIVLKSKGTQKYSFHISLEDACGSGLPDRSG